MSKQKGSSVSSSEAEIDSSSKLETSGQSRAELETKLINRAHQIYQRCLETDPQAHESLKKIGITSGPQALRWGLGWADGETFKGTMDKDQRRESVKVGLLGAKHQDRLMGRLTLPCIQDGKITGFIGWNTIRLNYKRVGQMALIHSGRLDQAESIILTDNFTKYCQIRQTGHDDVVFHPDINAIPDISWWVKSRGVSTVYVTSRVRATDLIKSVGDEVTVKKMIYVNNGSNLTPDDLDKMIKESEIVQSPVVVGPQDKTVDPVDKTEMVIDDITYKFDPLSLTSAKMKVILTAQAGDERYTDRIDLYLAVSRRAYAKGASERFLIDPHTIEADLHKVIGRLEAIRDQDITAEITGRVDLNEIDEAAAISTLKNPSILDEFVSDMRQTGFVGEDNNLKLGFLMSVSRLLDKPLSIIIQSSSGVGKSHLLNLLCQITPPESMMFMSKLTPSSLFYMPDLRHKMLCVDEAHGSSDALYPLRTLQSNHKLVLAVPMKDSSSGTTQTKQIMVKGPVSYIESTTSEKLHPENASRAFILKMDESPEQTRRILQAQLHDVMEDDSKPTDTLFRKWQNVQRVLGCQKFKVFIPFADKLKFPLGPNARRDHQKMLSLIQAVALMRSHQKTVTDGNIQASPEDYEIAHSLILPLMGNPLDELSERARELLQILQGRERVPFTRREIMEEHKIAYSRIWRAMEELLHQEIIAEEARAQGKAPYFTLLDSYVPGKDIEGLTSPQELFTTYSDTLNNTNPVES